MIYDSKFNFYLNTTKLITIEYCSKEYFQQNRFTWAKVLTFDHVFYTKNTCPFVFFTKSIEQITFGDISNSLIYNNQLEFIQLNETNNLESINNNLFYLSVKVAYVNITLKLIRD